MLNAAISLLAPLPSTVVSGQMETTWSDSQATREFYYEADVYLSLKTLNTLKKPPVPRKKTEKRDSRGLSYLAEDAQKKVKEKTSWLSLPRGNNPEPWRQATCRLSEEGDNCILNVYLGETLLFQKINVHTLQTTSIRQCDRSLFLRDHVLGLHCTQPQQRWAATPTTEPLYLALPSHDALLTWMTLLRSYAIPEVYGPEGGLYRVWRQVDLHIAQGRNFGASKSTSASTSLSEPPKEGSESEATDLDLYCEVIINQDLSARTVVKHLNSPDWHERFVFTDLPQYEDLVVVVLQEKKHTNKPVALGSVNISLTNFRRGPFVDGWFPVLLGSSSVTAPTQFGQLRLKIRVQEELILPQAAYSRVLDILDGRNYLDWMLDFDAKLGIKYVSSTLTAIAVARNMLLDHVLAVAERDLADAPNAQTLFRGNTTLTKTAEQLMGWYGKQWLEESLGNSIRRLCMEDVGIETDPTRGGTSKDVTVLLHWCTEFWKEIYHARHQCPPELRRLFQRVRELVAKRYSEQAKELQWQAVNAFCFLRYLVPAILHPQLHGLYPGLPETRIQRSLTLIAKTLQSLANLNVEVQKEEYMSPVKVFLQEWQPQMLDYIVAVSNPYTARTTQRSEEQSTRHSAIRALYDRKRHMSALRKDALPLPPHAIDVPRQLAIISAAILRQPESQDVASLQSQPLGKLCARFSDVEQEALWRVTSVTSALNIEDTSFGDSPGQTSASHLHDSGSDQPVKRSKPSLRVRPTTAPGKASRAQDPSESSSSTRPSTGKNDKRSSTTSRPSHIRTLSSSSLSGIGSTDSGLNSQASSPIAASDDTSKAKRNNFLRGWGRK